MKAATSFEFRAASKQILEVRGAFSKLVARGSRFKTQ
jgi:hypothetical protein